MRETWQPFVLAQARKHLCFFLFIYLYIYINHIKHLLSRVERCQSVAGSGHGGIHQSSGSHLHHTPGCYSLGCHSDRHSDWDLVASPPPPAQSRRSQLALLHPAVRFDEEAAQVEPRGKPRHAGDQSSLPLEFRIFPPSNPDPNHNNDPLRTPTSSPYVKRGGICDIVHRTQVCRWIRIQQRGREEPTGFSIVLLLKFL